MTKTTTKNRKRPTKKNGRPKKLASVDNRNRRKTKLTRGGKSTHPQSRPIGQRRRTCDVHLFDKLISTFDIAAKSIDDLDLVNYAKEAANTLLKAHPAVVFTSGRRSLKQQADAMADNVIKNRKWIEQTYAASAERDLLQKWVDDNPQAVTKSNISTGLEGIMNGWTDEQRKNLSRHFSGQAFDVQPVENGDAIKKTIKSLPNLRKFLEKEGGLIIWHADFEKV
jgi:hypothetical protein